ncbi:MAG: DNA alkylation repair protein, partial [Paludibacter sp.]
IRELANTNHLWSNRVAVVSTHYFIKRGDFSLILELSEKFLNHKHDLMQKAVGWMLREMGKIDEKPLYGFLDKHYKIMPRTMLRYSIERLPDEKRRHYMCRI